MSNAASKKIVMPGRSEAASRARNGDRTVAEATIAGAESQAGAGAIVPYAMTLLVRDNCLCLHVQRAARALARRFDDAFRPLGLTSGQFSLLMSLNRPQPASMKSVVHLLAMDRTTLTAALKPLERRGLVTVTAGAADKRSREMTLTVAGRKLLARATPIWKQHHGELDATLADPEALRENLRALA